MLLLVAALSVGMIGQKPCASTQEHVPPLTVVTAVELSTIAGKAAGRKIESFQELDNGRIAPANRFVARVRLVKKDGLGDAIVWTETQFLFAPLAKKFVQGDLDPIDLVGWGSDSNFKDLRIQRTTVGPKESEVSFGPFDLTPILPSDPNDNLWSWALRVIVHVHPSDGPDSTFTSHIYRLKPSDTRKKLKSVDYDPTVAEGEPVPEIPNPCKGTELDPHPK